LVYLAPGVTAGQVGENLSGASTLNPRAASNFNALGSQANTNAWLVDGIDNNEYTFNTVIVQPTVESVREFKVLTGTFSAEFGRGAGVVSVSTKSGQNAWHGTAFEYLRNEAFDAKNFFALPTAPKAPLHPQRLSRQPWSLRRQRHPGQPDRSRATQRRIHLPAAERARQLRQLHLDRQPLGARPQLHGPHRPPGGQPGQLLRPLQLREVQARRAAGTGRLLPAHARRGGAGLRPRAIRGRHPEYPPHHHGRC